MNKTVINADVYFDVFQFLLREAELLDNGDIDEWFNLMTEDIRYRVPVRTTRYRKDGSGISQKSTHVNDNYFTLKMRVLRFKTKYAWAEDPPSRTRHFISNIRIKRGERENELKVESYLLLYRSRGESASYEILSGERRDVLRRVTGEWKIAERVVVLDQSILSTHNLAVFL